MQSIFEVTAVFLVADSWPVQRVENTSTLHMQYQGDSGLWTCIAQTLEERRTLLFYSVCPLEIPRAKYGAVMEFITRANYGMLGGAFEFDLNDGDLRFRTSATLPDSDLTLSLVRLVVYDNVTSMDIYLPGIEAVINGQATPAQAIEHVEAAINRVDE
jgi:hypothetical protein